MRGILSVIVPVTFCFVMLILLTEVHWVFVIPYLFGVFDARARYAEYRELRGNFSCRKVVKMRRSLCQRMAAIAASPDMKTTVTLYYNMGYRWYHILPDGSYSLKDNVYLKPSWYLTLLGIKRNRSK